MVTIKQCIKLLHVKISVDISVQFQKIPISIANFANLIYQYTAR